MPPRRQPSPNEHPASSDFRQFFVAKHKIGCAGSLTEDNDNAGRYLPDAARESFFSDNSRVSRILHALFPELHNHGPLPVPLKDVQGPYSKSFATLLYIGEGRAISYFVESPFLADDKLPFKSRPDDFPPAEDFDDDLWTRFYNSQWMFCPPKLRYSRHTIWHSRTILPFKRCEELGRGRSGRTNRIEIDPSYDELTDQVKFSGPGAAESSGAFVVLTRLTWLRRTRRLTLFTGLKSCTRTIICPENLSQQ